MTKTKTKSKAKAIERYKNTNCVSVSTFYGRPSTTKCAIEQDILREMTDRNGFRYRVVGGNCFMFIAAYMFKKDEQFYLRWLTRSTCIDYSLTDTEVKYICQ